MLIFVHLTQVARAITTFETMRGQGQVGPLLTAVAAGTMSVDGAQINGPGGGPDPTTADCDSHAHKKKKEGCLAQWSKLLGLDTFYTVAFQGYKRNKADKDAARRSKQSNPFTRGLFRNCQDFWMDGPFFGRKDSGKGLLGGKIVDYTSLYDVPRGGMRYRSGYESVAQAEEGIV